MAPFHFARSATADFRTQTGYPAFDPAASSVAECSNTANDQIVGNREEFRAARRMGSAGRRFQMVVDRACRSAIW